MTIKASARSALILAAGLFVCFAGPSQAATGAAATAGAKSEAVGPPLALIKPAKHSSHQPKKYAHRESDKAAVKSAADKETDPADDSDNSSASSAIPPSVANANAQMAAADTPTGKASAMSARANEILQAAPDTPAAAQPATDAQVVAPDQLNDVDRALRDSAAPAPAMAMASAEAPATPAQPVAASSNEHSTWDETSLIGKIFIGFGALLTMASAARMFMA